MKYYSVFLPLINPEKSKRLKNQHVNYVGKLRDEGKIYANGHFNDGAGDLVIYYESSYETVETYVQRDPYVFHKARDYEIHEWEMIRTDNK
ncbi:hypothetical protein N0O92_18215 [Alkalihalobacillus sp. MEB130]|uniref:YciI family protein n=1 Tax=Alkalihalobacillus sp. MEB130 TaxID=2976704 RepID=UPI0028E074BA|nr:YciI family protein [Alkalihalobacillus sp. MEB130]MDT8862150.1 hypothetical protein [Alkalihalobacillus sp. MEB130]